MERLKRDFVPKRTAAGSAVSSSISTVRLPIPKQPSTLIKSKHTTLYARLKTELIFLTRFSLIQGVVYSHVGPWMKTWTLKHGAGMPELCGPLVYVTAWMPTRNVHVTLVRSYAFRERRTTNLESKSSVVSLPDHIH
jgi:hypothetical protein